MSLVATLIFILQISYALCRHVVFQHNSDNLQLEQKLPKDVDKFGHIEEAFYSNLFDTGSDKKVTTKMREGTNSNQQLSTLSKSENDVEAGREKRAAHDTGSEEITETEKDLNNKLDNSIERYVSTFYIDMIKLFQNELKEIGDREVNVRVHRRKHRKLPSLRPKRSLRSLLKDVHIKNLLRKYFQQKQNQDHGNPLLRYG